MEVSKYNIIVEKDKGVKIFNSVSQVIIELDSNHYKSFTNDLSLFSNEEKEYLIKNNFLVSNNDYQEKMKEKIIEDNNGIFGFCIMPTLQCNFRCSYCYEKRNNKHLKREDYYKIIEFIYNSSNKYKRIGISWFGGEPTLYLDDIARTNRKIKNIAKEKGKPFEGVITTNFYLLNKKKFLKLLNSGIHTFQVTIDGNKNTHDKYRKLSNGSGTFDTILNNLIDVKKINCNYKIIIRLNYDNITDYSSYILMMSTYFKKDNRFEFIFRPISNWDNKSRDYVCNYDQGFNKRLELINYAKNCGLNVLNDLFSLYQGCYVYYPNYYIIYNDLSLKKCSVNFDKEDNNYGSFRNPLKENNIFKFDDCEKCALFPLCRGGACKYDNVSRNYCEINRISEITKIISTF